MLAHRQQFQMREAEVACIRHQRVGEFAVIQPAPAIGLAPGAQMHFVHGHRRAQGVGCGTRRLHRPSGRQSANDAGGAGPQFRLEGVGVGFERDLVVCAQNFKFVDIAPHHLGQKDFPYPAAVAQAHGVTPPVPLVEVADHRHPFRVGCPHSKAGARHARAGIGMRAQAFVGPLVRTFCEQPSVGVGQEFGKRVGVIEQRGAGGTACTLVPMDPQLVVKGHAASGQCAAENTAVTHARQAAHQPLRVALDHVHRMGVGQQGVDP